MARPPAALRDPPERARGPRRGPGEPRGLPPRRRRGHVGGRADRRVLRLGLPPRAEGLPPGPGRDGAAPGALPRGAPVALPREPAPPAPPAPARRGREAR